jgi:hypothetical protein
VYTQEIILKDGYATLDEALSPFWSALSDLRQIVGNIEDPDSRVFYRYGGGRGAISIPIRVTAEKCINGYAVILRVTRIPVAELVGTGVGVIVLAVVVPFKAFTTGPVIFLLLSFFLGVGSRLYFVLRAGQLAKRNIAAVYEQSGK